LGAARVATFRKLHAPSTDTPLKLGEQGKTFAATFVDGCMRHALSQIHTLLPPTSPPSAPRLSE